MPVLCFFVEKFHDHPTGAVHHQTPCVPNVMVSSTQLCHRATAAVWSQHTSLVTNLVESKTVGLEDAGEISTPPHMTATTAVMAKP